MGARDELSFDAEAWQLAVTTGAPLVFAEPASWLVANPFEPAASYWLVLPLVSGGELAGVVIASAPAAVSLDPVGVTTLSSLGDLLSAGIAHARLRQQVERTEVERERMRLAAELHDGLAQDLALAVREIAALGRGAAARGLPAGRGPPPGGRGRGPPRGARAASRTSVSRSRWAASTPPCRRCASASGGGEQSRS